MLAINSAVAFSPFDDLLWGKIDSLCYKCCYTFTANGNWDVAANWGNNLIPPAILNKEAVITISPLPGGECILNVPQTISSGTNLIIPSSIKFSVLGNLEILDQ